MSMAQVWLQRVDVTVEVLPGFENFGDVSASAFLRIVLDLFVPLTWTDSKEIVDEHNARWVFEIGGPGVRFDRFHTEFAFGLIEIDSARHVYSSRRCFAQVAGNCERVRTFRPT